LGYRLDLLGKENWNGISPEVREGSDGKQQVQRSQWAAQEQFLQRVRVEDEGERVTFEGAGLEIRSLYT
jgi:hypothetical protein